MGNLLKSIKLPRFSEIKKIITLMSKKDMYQLSMIFVLSTIGSFLEVLGIAVLIPVINVVGNPDVVNNNQYVQPVLEQLNIKNNQQLRVLFAAILLFVFLFKNTYFALLYKIQLKFTANKKYLLATDLLEKYLRSSYYFHKTQNTYNLLRNVSSSNILTDKVIVPMMLVVVELQVLVVILLFLVAVQPIPTLMAISLMGTVGVIFYAAIKSKIEQNVKINYDSSFEMGKWINQALGSIKETKVLKLENFFLKTYSKHAQVCSEVGAQNQWLSMLPRMLIETALVSMISLYLLYISYKGGDLTQLISALVILAGASIRIMPSVTRMMLSFIQISEGLTQLNFVYEGYASISTSEQEKSNPRNASKLASNMACEIKIESVNFQYPDSRAKAVDAVSMNILAGATVGFVGHSGSGKTTLIDNIMGLLDPTSGSITIANQGVREYSQMYVNAIAYVPQNIFLIDDTIKNNIAFGIEDSKISDENVWKALELACLDEFVKTLPRTIYEPVGENGGLLSGGQKQRIGIARALYNDPALLVMDEVTSALDNETEQAIIRSLKKLKGQKTMILIAHRMSTVQHCDILYFFDKGKIVASGSYKELLSNSAEFQKFVEVVAT